MQPYMINKPQNCFYAFSASATFSRSMLRSGCLNQMYILFFKIEMQTIELDCILADDLVKHKLCSWFFKCVLRQLNKNHINFLHLYLH